MLLKRKKRSVELVLTPPPLCGNVHNFLTLPLENDIVCVAKVGQCHRQVGIRVCPLYLSGYPCTLGCCSRGATQVFNFPSGSLSLSLEASFLLPVIK